MNLFADDKNVYSNLSPLADRIRPEIFSEFFGQDNLVGRNKILRLAIEKDEIPSMIFWGPPGSGKTTLAKIIAKSTKSFFIEISAAAGSIKEVKKIIIEAKKRFRLENIKTILFIDEIHRFNKLQQDYFLPFVEKGDVILIGATTENPSFEVNSSLLSRCRVFVFSPLKNTDIVKIIKRALTNKEKGFGDLNIDISDKNLLFLSNMANGDARFALNALEIAVKSSFCGKNKIIKIDEDKIKEAFQKSHLFYDKAGEEHYNIISALHKSMRGSDENASLYWLARMLEAGEDPLYIARRIIRFASEDIGIANPAALTQAIASYNACQYIGMPECAISLAQAVLYMAKCSKSNSIYVAYEEARKDVLNGLNEPVSLHLRNAPTQIMKNLGYGKGYKYNPDFKGNVKQDYFPKNVKNKKYFRYDKEDKK